MLSLLIPLALQGTSDLADRWRFHLEDIAIQEQWQKWSLELEPTPFVVEGVDVVDVVSGTLRAGCSVRVRGERIEWIGPAAEAKPAPDEVRIDGRGKFLMPGLVDMHMHHLTSSSHPLLELACGVTTTRDMCGFPWLLEWRDQVHAGELLAPDLFVAGHILNGAPMDMYATVVRTEEAAREEVARQVEAGYDFIKTHNNLALDVYRAILDEARLAGIAVVGHVPHRVTLAEAFSQGQATLEHFKGYILDQTLELTGEDYVALTREARPWNCPTLVTATIGFTGERAERFLRTAPGMRYVSAVEREQWLARAKQAPTENSHARVEVLSEEIFRALLPVSPRFLAGTDAGGGYEHMIPGFALLDELERMEALGLPTAEVLRTATVNAAEALGQAGKQGSVEVGQRANLLLLDANPLERAAHVRRAAGVAVRGLWLSRSTLDAILGEIELVMSHGGSPPTVREPSSEELDRFVERLERLHASGAVFMHHHLEEIAGLLRRAGRAEDAERVLARNAPSRK